MTPFQSCATSFSANVRARKPVPPCPETWKYKVAFSQGAPAVTSLRGLFRRSFLFRTGRFYIHPYPLTAEPWRLLERSQCGISSLVAERVSQRTMQSVSHARRLEELSTRSRPQVRTPTPGTSCSIVQAKGGARDWEPAGPTAHGFSVVWHRAPERTVTRIAITAANPIVCAPRARHRGEGFPRHGGYQGGQPHSPGETKAIDRPHGPYTGDPGPECTGSLFS